MSSSARVPFPKKVGSKQDGSPAAAGEAGLEPGADGAMVSDMPMDGSTSIVSTE